MTAPFAVSQYTTGGQSFERDRDLLTSLGIGAIEVCEAKLNETHADPQLRSLADAGLRITSVQPRYHSPFPNSLRARPAEPAERMRRLRRSIGLFGRHAPGATLVVNTGLAPGGDLAAAHRTAIREFRGVARAAADAGVRIGLEPLNPVYMNTDTFIASLAHADRILDAVDHPAFGLFLDLWHVWEDPQAPRRIAGYGDRLFGVHLSDWRPPRAFGDRLLPGQGEIPTLTLLRAVRRAGYRGVYTLEIFSDLRLPDSLWKNPRRTVAAGQKAFERIWRQLCG